MANTWIMTFDYPAREQQEALQNVLVSPMQIRYYIGKV
jgi:hypothetical protein